MNEEFPQLDFSENQNRFLREWWKESKVYIGARNTGKTTLLACEARRFVECGMDVIFFSSNKQKLKQFKRDYVNLFKETVGFPLLTYDSDEYYGLKPDVVLMDDIYYTHPDRINEINHILTPMFKRFTSDQVFYEDYKDNRIFDCVYP